MNGGSCVCRERGSDGSRWLSLMPEPSLTTFAQSPRHSCLVDPAYISWTSAATWLILGRTDNYRRKFAMKLTLWGLQVTAICSSLLLTLCTAHDGGLHLKVTGKRNPPNSRYSKRGNVIGSSTLSNSADVSYYANITLGGTAFSVLIGTCDPPLS